MIGQTSRNPEWAQREPQRERQDGFAGMPSADRQRDRRPSRQATAGTGSSAWLVLARTSRPHWLVKGSGAASDA